uniref:Uncharacterized protein n=1 Tax=Chromera velia CCMP2878 TaxID=1169474 RepID=A0A0G4HIL9_9ALVE|eukprot:Cvel_27899.t1-p1 / transcript=Cvel_27899.t1 / gene=Cvel_27899 / organism=Chromera_velia_CCMP2878 / gene_product=hypothetical protein / transcript_product=hypothetical protein / location=Cvel_scaffold3553:8073-9213(-) / protein_length=176 / sequence_SO=supercontig / SO=protein_coding / is_pseudo=false
MTQLGSEGRRVEDSSAIRRESHEGRQAFVGGDLYQSESLPYSLPNGGAIPGGGLVTLRRLHPYGALFGTPTSRRQMQVGVIFTPRPTKKDLLRRCLSPVVACQESPQRKKEDLAGGKRDFRSHDMGRDGIKKAKREEDEDENEAFPRVSWPCTLLLLLRECRAIFTLFFVPVWSGV